MMSETNLSLARREIALERRRRKQAEAEVEKLRAELEYPNKADRLGVELIAMRQRAEFAEGLARELAEALRLFRHTSGTTGAHLWPKQPIHTPEEFRTEPDEPCPVCDALTRYDEAQKETAWR